jgi:hypothetical protein
MGGRGLRRTNDCSTFDGLEYIIGGFDGRERESVGFECAGLDRQR